MLVTTFTVRGDITEVVAGPCVECGQFNMVKCDTDGFFKWQGGEKIQLALPGLSATERELLISGTCGPCWDKMWGGGD